MTPSQVKRALRANRRAAVRPWSQYQISKMRGCGRAFVSMWLAGKITSAPMERWCDVAFGLVPPPPDAPAGSPADLPAVAFDERQAKRLVRRLQKQLEELEQHLGVGA